MVGLASKSCEIVRAAKGGNCSLGVGHSFGCAGSEVWVAPGCGGTFAIGGKRLHCSAVHAHTQARCAALDSSRPLTIAVGICPRPAHHLCMIILSAMAGSRYIGGGVAIATPVASNHAQPVSSTFWPMQPLLRHRAFARRCGVTLSQGLLAETPMCTPRSTLLLATFACSRRSRTCSHLCRCCRTHVSSSIRGLLITGSVRSGTGARTGGRSTTH